MAQTPRTAKPMGQAGRWRTRSPVGPMKASGVARPRRCDPWVLRPCLFGSSGAPDAACWVGSGKAHDAWRKGSPMAPGWARARPVQRDRVRRLMRAAPVV